MYIETVVNHLYQYSKNETSDGMLSDKTKELQS